MKKSISRNFLLNMIYQTVIIIIPMIIIPFLAERLQPEGIGQYSYSYSVVTYFSSFALLGIQMYGTKIISIVSDNEELLCTKFWELFVFKLVTSSISIVSFYIIAIFVNQPLYYIQGLVLFANLLDITWFFTGTERFKSIVLRNLTIKICSLILILTLIKNPSHVNLYAMILVAAELLGQIVMWIDISKYKIFNNFKETIKKIKPFRHLKGTISIFAPQVILIINTSINITIIGLFYTKESVGYYDMALKIVNTIVTVISALGLVMIPRISILHKNNDYTQISKFMNQAISVLSYLAYPLCLGLIAVSSVFIPWFLTEAFYPTVLIIMVLSFKIIFAAINNVIGIQYMVSTEQQGSFFLSVLVGFITNLIFCLVLIPLVGPIGAAISAVVGELTITIFEILLTKKQIGFLSYIVSQYKIIISSTIMFISVFAIKTYYYQTIIDFIATITNVPQLIIPFSILSLLLLGVIVYLISCCLLRDETQSFIFKKGLQILKIKKD